ncbi:MAG: hypothetical protein AB1697_11205 [Pseudomonadota bacterium]
MIDDTSSPMTWGAAATALGMLGFATWMATQDRNPVERRALRIGAAAGVLGIVLVFVGVWVLYTHVSETAGLFMILPCLPDCRGSKGQRADSAKPKICPAIA